MYIKRDIEESILELTNEYSCLLLTGAILCARECLSAIDSNTLLFPISKL